MYSNYLTEVGKLVFLIGEIEATSSFKKLLDTDHKGKYFFKCIDELPMNSYQKIKIKARRTGILRCDWFNKILDRSPMMIFMVLNYTQPLQANQKWEDRLRITIRKLNKVVQILRSFNKQQTIFKIVIIISKESVMQSREPGNTFNIIEKITSFLKSYQKDLFIFQYDLLSKEVNKNKNTWFSMLDKAYQRKYRAINKRKDQCTSERRIGCVLKMAILSQIMNRKQSYQSYDQAYKTLHFHFNQLTNGRQDPSNFQSIRQCRSLADIIFLRMLIVKINISTNHTLVPELISRHIKYFTQKNIKHYFFTYQNLIWKQNFLQNLLRIVHINQNVQFLPKNYFCQLANGTIDLAYRLSTTHQELQQILNQQEIKGRLIPTEQQVYIGSNNYSLGVEITDVDVVWTQMNNLIERRKDYITLGIQNISRFKSMKLFKQNQLTFLNAFLMRFYIADQKYNAADTLSRIIAIDKLKKNDYYLLNGILKQIQGQPNRTQEQLIKIYGIGTLLADCFCNKTDLQKYSTQLINICKKLKPSHTTNTDLLEQNSNNSQQIDFKLMLPLGQSSDILKIWAYFPTKLHPIQEKLEIRIQYQCNIARKLLELDGNVQMEIFFNHLNLNHSQQITLQSPQSQFNLTIIPLQFFNKDETLSITHITLKIKQYPFLLFYVSKINYNKYQQVVFYTKLQPPQIKINMPYETYYINQVSKFTIEVGRGDQAVSIDAVFMIDQDQLADKTQIYAQHNNKMNLVNSKRSSPLRAQAPNIIYMRSNRLGHKMLKFTFNMTISQKIGDKTLMNSYKISKQFAFKVANLFKTIKIIKQSFTGQELKSSQIPPNKKIILNYCMRTTQTINILELGQHNNPKQSIKLHKSIKPINNMIVNPEQKLKNIVIFEIIEDLLNQEEANKQIFVVSFYVKWARIDMDMRLNIDDGEHPCENLYVQNQFKILLKCDQIQVEYQEGVVLQRYKKQSLSIKYKNLTNKEITVYTIMDNSESILRVGSRSMATNLGAKQTQKLTFQILPIKSGYQHYPNVRHFFDGIQASNKTYKNFLCVL